MEEPLYGIEIQKERGIYLGRMYSDGGSVKEFKSHKIDLLFRDMIYDMRLALGEFSNRDAEYNKDGKQIKQGQSHIEWWYGYESHRLKEGEGQYKISFYLSLDRSKNMIVIFIKILFPYIVKKKISVYCMIYTCIKVREWGRLKVVKRDFLKLRSPPFIKYILDIDI